LGTISAFAFRHRETKCVNLKIFITSFRPQDGLELIVDFMCHINIIIIIIISSSSSIIIVIIIIVVVVIIIIIVIKLAVFMSS